MSYDRKAMSAEPQSLAAKYGNRWEDLIEAAASATEEDSRDLTPVNCMTTYLTINQLILLTDAPFSAAQ
jgi:hypothetical protein